MAFTIRQRDEKWRIAISEEDWEFEDKMDMEQCLEKLIEFKEKFVPKKRCKDCGN